MTNERFKLSLLIYGVDLSDSDKAELDKKIKVTDRASSDLYVVRYITNKDLYIINNRLEAESNLGNYIVPELIKSCMSDTTKYLFRIGYSTSVVLKDVTNVKNLSIIEDVYKLFGNYTSFTTSFKNKLIYGPFLNGSNDLEFDDEKHLHKYLLYVMNSVSNIKSKGPIFEDNYYHSSRIVSDSALKDLGWSSNGSPSKKRKADRIISVHELDNWRLFECIGSGRIYFGAVHSDHEVYSYIDIDRVFLEVENFKFTKIFNDIDVELKSSELKLLNDYYESEKSETTPEVSIITKELIEELGNADEKRKMFEKRQESLSKVLKTKVKYKLGLLEKGKETFKLNDIEYNTDSITYSGQLIEVKTTHQHLQKMGYMVLDNLYNDITSGSYYYTPSRRRKHPYFFGKADRLSSINDISFDTVYEEFMAIVFHDHLEREINKIISDKLLHIVVGDVEVKMTTIERVNKNHIKSKSFYLNGNKINKDDIYTCMYQAISYATQKEYDDFLASVSYTSLTVHKLTKTGLVIDTYDNILRKSIKLNIPVTRVKNKNFLVINGNKKSIKKTARVLTLANSNRRTNIIDIINTLQDPTVIENLTYDDLKNFVHKGQEEYDAAQAKIQGFIDKTLTSLDIVKKSSVLLDNGIKLSNVFEVKGKLRTYYVESKDPYKIYSSGEGRYICMLDKTPYVAPEVKLINRLYALKNDSLISKEVSTLDF